LREASAFAPGHITGFFQICDDPEDPLMKGSRGAGFSVDMGVQTRVLVEPSERDVVSIVMNGSVTGEAVVSENVVRRMLAKAEEPQRVEVTHEIETPIGAGFGSSGGGALTIALAMNEALGLGISYVDASRVAHLAEIECKTGLGTVFAATQGGFGVLYKPGAPGIGESIKYDRSDELAAFVAHFGPISTREALDEIKGNLGPHRFMELSREFTDYVGITTPRIKAVLDAADEAGVPCSMAMFGEALFSLVEKDEAGRVAEFYREAVPGRSFRALSIDERGARLL